MKGGVIMKGTNAKRALLVSSSVILLCMAVIVGTTWALFTDTQKTSNHLQAGDLNITLKRTELTKTTLNSLGELEEQTVQSATDDAVDFTDSTDKNVFDIESSEKIVPGTKFVSKMQIENHSDVAFGYWIEVVCSDKTQGEELAKQLKVTVNTGVDSSALVGNGLTVKGAGENYVDELAVGEIGVFTVTVEFLDSAIAENGIGDNNLAKNQSLDFDLIVHAVQLTTLSDP